MENPLFLWFYQWFPAKMLNYINPLTQHFLGRNSRSHGAMVQDMNFDRPRNSMQIKARDRVYRVSRMFGK